MEEPSDDPSDDPIVVLDDEEESPAAAPPPAPPPRRRPWIWGALPGALVLIGLGALALWLPKRRPEDPPAIAASAATATLPETPTPVPPETAPLPPLDDPPEMEPPAPQPEARPVATADPPPAPTAAKTPDPPPLAAPPAPRPTPEEIRAVQKELASAATAIREAEPLFGELAGAIEHGDPREVAAKIDRVEDLLRAAQESYGRRRNDAPDPETVEARMAVLDELLEALKEGRERIRVPLALKEAEALERQAQARGVGPEEAVARLLEARERYALVRHQVPDPKSVDRKIRRIDAQLQSLHAR
jgi:hypothetical protein